MKKCMPTFFLSLLLCTGECDLFFLSMLTCYTSLAIDKILYIRINVYGIVLNVLSEYSNGDTIFHWHIILSPVRNSPSSSMYIKRPKRSFICMDIYVLCMFDQSCCTKICFQLSAVTFGPDQQTDFHVMWIADKQSYNKPRMWCNEMLSKHTWVFLCCVYVYQHVCAIEYRNSVRVYADFHVFDG